MASYSLDPQLSNDILVYDDIALHWTKNSKHIMMFELDLHFQESTVIP